MENRYDWVMKLDYKHGGPGDVTIRAEFKTPDGSSHTAWFYVDKINDLISGNVPYLCFTQSEIDFGNEVALEKK